MPLFPRRVTFADAFKQAVVNWDAPDATPENKLRLRLAVALNVDAREAINDFLTDVDNAAEGGGQFAALVTPSGVDLDNLQKLLELIIQYLPQILAIILPLFAQ